MEDPGTSAEREVAVIVTELIVDHLEVIHVRIAYYCDLILINGIVQLLLGIGDKTSSVVEPRELVFLRDLFEFCVVSYKSLQ